MTPILPFEFLSVPLAHRALHDVKNGRPENSRAAIRAAIAAGYGIEIDVQLSADAQAMVFHDYQMNRLTNDTGAVRSHTCADLGNIQLTGGTEGIPALVEILDIIAGRTPVLIELKDQDRGMGADIGPLEQAVANAVQGYAGLVALMSFNPHSVRRMADVLPNIPRGLVTGSYRYKKWPLPHATCDRLRDIPDFEGCRASFVSHEIGDLDRPRVTDLRASGVPVLCWTVKSATQEASVRGAADNITFEGYLAEISP